MAKKSSKKSTKKKESSRKVQVWLHRGSFGVLAVTVLSTFGLQVAMAGKVAPNTLMLNSLIEFEKGETVQEEYSLLLDEFEQKNLVFTYRGNDYEFTLDALGIKLDKTKSVQTIPVIDLGTSPWSFDGGLLGEKEVAAHFGLDEEKFVKTLTEAVFDLNKSAVEPQLTWNTGTQDFDIISEEDGWKADLEGLKTQLGNQINQLNNHPIELNEIPLYPLITAAELESVKRDLRAKLDSSTTLKAEGDQWTIDWLDHLDLITFEPVKTIEAEGVAIELQKENDENADFNTALPIETTLKLQINEQGLIDYVNENISEDIEIEKEDVIISLEDDGDVVFEGTATDGIKVSHERLADLLEISLNQQVSEVELPLTKTPGVVDVADELADRGITELVSTGYSGYWGSTYNRQHNIRTAIGRFNGLIVEPGETFSFGEALGMVDGSTGYAKELVIKEGETIPEYGGGVCQVSSTLFRAVLFGGYPIVERHPHSYAVSYYAFPLGWGLDATVYPPQVDLKFTNDQETPILIQAYQEGSEAYFKFYGTKDYREVDMDGPFISNRVGAPPPVITETNQLAPGVRQKVDSAHNGFTAAWTRTVTYPDGRVETEDIISRYKAWAEKWNVGIEVE
jgi:vancomycin resistance protein YoaR